MNIDFIFYFLTYGVLPFWLLLVAAPRWKWTNVIVQSVFVPLLLSSTYIMLMFLKPERIEGASIESISALAILLSSPFAALIAWIHLLTFDLFIAAWMVRDAKSLNINRWWITPGLLLCYPFGPAGLAYYLLVRSIVFRETKLLSVCDAC